MMEESGPVAELVSVTIQVLILITILKFVLFGLTLLMLSWWLVRESASVSESAIACPQEVVAWLGGVATRRAVVGLSLGCMIAGSKNQLS